MITLYRGETYKQVLDYIDQKLHQENVSFFLVTAYISYAAILKHFTLHHLSLILSDMRV